MDFIMSQVLESPTKAAHTHYFHVYSSLFITRIQSLTTHRRTQTCSLAIYSNNSNLTITKMYFILFNWKLCVFVFVNVLHLARLDSEKTVQIALKSKWSQCVIVSWTEQPNTSANTAIILIRRESSDAHAHMHTVCMYSIESRKYSTRDE